MKARPLAMNKVMLLLDFIVKHTVITSKTTISTNNKLKQEAWKAIFQEFSAHVGKTRRPEQLRLEWENLKKAFFFVCMAEVVFSGRAYLFYFLLQKTSDESWLRSFYKPK